MACTSDASAVSPADTTPSPTTATSVSAPAATDPCRREPPAVQDSSPAQAVLLAVDTARLNDLRCGAPTDRVRVCRALLVIATVDPAQVLDDVNLRMRAADAVLWATHDALEVATDELADALSTISYATQDLINAPSDQARARAIQERAAPPVPATIDGYWERQCR